MCMSSNYSESRGTRYEMGWEETLENSVKELKESLGAIKKNPKILEYMKEKIIQNCTFRVFISGDAVNKYLFELNNKKYLKNAKISSIPATKAYILSRMGVEYTTNQILPEVIKPIILHLGEKAWLYVETKEFKYDITTTLYFFGKKVLPHIIKFIKFYDNLYKNDMLSFTYLDKEDEFYAIRENKKIRAEDFFMDEKLKNRIFHYLDKSIRASNAMWEKYGVVKNPGILLHGKPGTGKSTFARILSKKYSASVYYITPQSFARAIVQLRNLRNNVTDELFIVCIEDIDIIWSSRETLSKKEEKNEFNTLLQFLDGSLSLPRMIKIATTNHIERLDHALIRPGRFGLVEELSELDEDLAEKMCNRYGLNLKDLAEKISFPINPALLYEKIVENMNVDKI